MSETRKCQAIKSTGGRCERVVHGDATHCYSHDPNTAERRRAAASKAARAKGPDGEIGRIKARIKEISEGVLSGEFDKSRGSVCIQGYGVLRGFLDLEMKRREQLEFEQRLAQLEAEQSQEKAS